MNAPELLATLRERGARLTVRSGDGGAAVLNVAPRGIASDLAGEVARFKPSLLELLEREQVERLELARTVLESKRANGPGFDFAKVRPFWRAVCELEGRELDSPALSAWARRVLGIEPDELAPDNTSGTLEHGEAGQEAERDFQSNNNSARSAQHERNARTIGAAGTASRGRTGANPQQPTI